MIEILSYESKKRLFSRLVEECGNFELNDANLHLKFKEYCKLKNLPVSKQVLDHLMYRNSIILKEEETMGISDLIEGVYSPEFIGKSSKVFGISSLEDRLRKYTGKEIKIIIASE